MNISVMQIDIEIDLQGAERFLKAFSKKELIKAHRRALNRTAVGLRKESTIAIKKRLRLKSGDIKKKNLRIKKAIGSRFESLEAAVEFSGTPIPMIEFVRGSKKPINQKGKKVGRRRAVKVEIKPGRRFKLRHGFIATVKSKQIFRRSGKGKSDLKKQSIKAPSVLVGKDKFRSPLERYVRSRYEREIESALKHAVENAQRAVRGVR
jgi:hypothetical protein